MDRPHWSLQDARNSFSAVVDAAVRGRPQTVTKRGKPAAVVVSVVEYDRLCRRQTTETPSFIDQSLAMPQDDGIFERSQAAPRDREF